MILPLGLSSSYCCKTGLLLYAQVAQGDCYSLRNSSDWSQVRMIFFFSCLFFGSKKILIILYWLLSPFQDQSLVPKYWGNMTGQTQLQKVFCAQRSGFIIEKEAMRTVNYPSCICLSVNLHYSIILCPYTYIILGAQSCWYFWDIFKCLIYLLLSPPPTLALD